MESRVGIYMLLFSVFLVAFSAFLVTQQNRELINALTEAQGATTEAVLKLGKNQNMIIKDVVK